MLRMCPTSQNRYCPWDRVLTDRGEVWCGQLQALSGTLTIRGRAPSRYRFTSVPPEQQTIAAVFFL